jgi:hypothetical protein
VCGYGIISIIKFLGIHLQSICIGNIRAQGGQRCRAGTTPDDRCGVAGIILVSIADFIKALSGALNDINSGYNCSI